MNNRFHSNSKAPNAELLALSQASVAVLLAFAAAQAKADDASAASIAVLPGAASPADAQGSEENEQAASEKMDAAPAASIPLSLSAPANGPGGAGAGSTNAAQPMPAEPKAVQFNSQFLSGSGAKSLDISRFNQGNVAAAGQYRAALYVNQVWIGVTDVTLRDVAGPNHAAQPVVDRDLLMRMEVDTARLSDAAREKLDAADKGEPVLLPDLIPQATATFDMGEQRLDVSVPQAMMSRNARGWVDPKYWDDGINAAVLQYNANVYHSSGDGFSNTQSYLGLNTGVNLGPWRFRYNGNITNTSGSSSNSGTHVQSMQTYLQRSFAPIKSQLTLGDSYTDGAIFDSFGVRGVQMGTDDRMYPESQRGYAPTVRGIANSNAKVQVKQNGNIIYETTVAPGAFVIDDLYPTGYGGDLQVVVTEADGSQHVSAVPYAAPVNALREGRWRYNVAAGQYRNASLNSTPFVFEAQVQRGLNNFVTVYGGTIFADNYASAAAGVALDTPIGAFGFDVTQANASLDNQPSHNGQSLRLSYSRTFTPTSTDVTLAAYRYSTSGFLSFQDAMNLRDLSSRGVAYSNQGIQKGRLQLTLNQNLGTYGSIYASGFTQNYWNKSNSDTSFQVGYNTNIRRVGVGVSASRELDTDSGHWSTRFMVNLSVPLDLGSSVANSMTSYTHDTRDNSNLIQETFTGSLGKDYQFSYGVTAGHQWGGQSGNSINGNAGYLSPVTQIRANAGSANGYTQVGGGLTGSMVMYSGGVVLSPQTGDTFALIEAKDAAGARVASSPGVLVNGGGQALIAGMEPYSLNTVEIDTKGLPMGVELKSTEQHFAPTAGSVVRVKFDTVNRGQAIVMRVRRLNGDPVPFGADVLDAEDHIIGTVSQGSRATFFTKEAQGDLTLRWGEGAQQRCRARYDLPQAPTGKPGSTVFAETSCQ